MAHTGLGRWIGIGLVLVLLGGCNSVDRGAAPVTTEPVPVTTEPEPPTTEPELPTTVLEPPTTPSNDSREALYDYCDQATGQDPNCWSSRYGNNLRALDQFLQGPDEFGGQQRLEVDGAQGLAAAAPVGTDVDFVSSTLVGINFVTDETSSAGLCRTAVDSEARVGVVTVLTDGPLGPREIVQAYIIGNPVFRMGRSLSDAAAGLGAPGIGVMSNLTDLQTAYPDLEVLVEEGHKVAFTPPEQARQQLATSSTERQMVFYLGTDDRIDSWIIGVPQYAANLCG